MPVTWTARIIESKRFGYVLNVAVLAPIGLGLMLLQVLDDRPWSGWQTVGVVGSSLMIAAGTYSMFALGVLRRRRRRP